MSKGNNAMHKPKGCAPDYTADSLNDNVENIKHITLKFQSQHKKIIQVVFWIEMQYTILSSWIKLVLNIIKMFELCIDIRNIFHTALGTKSVFLCSWHAHILNIHIHKGVEGSFMQGVTLR